MATTQDVKIRAFQRKLYMLSKQEVDYRFYSLYDKVCRRDILREAYRQWMDGKSNLNKTFPSRTKMRLPAIYLKRYQILIRAVSE